MPEKRSPRRLEDVSHLFLTGGRPAERFERRPMEAAIWLVSVDASAGRAHLAAGLACAFARSLTSVSLMEVARGLPNVGYYFGMEPFEYLAPALRRSALASGTWEGTVRFCFAANISPFARYRGEPPPAAAPRAIIVSFPYPEGPSRKRFFESLRAVSGVVSADGPRDLVPDAVVLVGDGASAPRFRRAMSELREIAPGAIVDIVSSGSAGVPVDADERFSVPEGLRVSWARRMPPADPFFGDLAASLSQVISQRRRKAVDHAANE